MLGIADAVTADKTIFPKQLVIGKCHLRCVEVRQITLIFILGMDHVQARLKRLGKPRQHGGVALHKQTGIDNTDRYGDRGAVIRLSQHRIVQIIGQVLEGDRGPEVPPCPLFIPG